MAFKHGYVGSPEYETWKAMKKRCYSRQNNRFYLYGARGVTVCERWRNSFINFLADMGIKPSPKHTLDRYPNRTGNYEPGNCRWATYTEQARNRNGSLRVIEYQGQKACITELAEKVHISKSTIFSRLQRGWSVERAITEKADSRKLPKLSDSKVREIKERLHQGTSNAALARQFNVNPATIRSIRLNRTWRDV